MPINVYSSYGRPSHCPVWQVSSLRWSLLGLAVWRGVSYLTSLLCSLGCKCPPLVHVRKTVFSNPHSLENDPLLPEMEVICRQEWGLGKLEMIGSQVLKLQTVSTPKAGGE